MAQRLLLTVAALTAAAAADTATQYLFEVENLDGGGTGQFTVEVHPEWAPLGAARFTELVQQNFFTDVRFFRVVKGFMAQFGISGDPSTAAAWRDKKIQDDPNKEHNTRGRLTFAMAGPGTRTSQIFINFGDNKFLDSQGFSPFAKVTQGMDIVDKLYNGYGEGAPSGHGPSQGQLQSEGNTYLKASFPKLTYIKKVTVIGDAPAVEAKFAVEQGNIDTSNSAGSGVSLFVTGSLGMFALVVCFWVATSRMRSTSRDDAEAVRGEEMHSPGSIAGNRKRGYNGDDNL